jgi:hypothetical protein
VDKPLLIVIDTLEKIRLAAKPHIGAYTTDYAAITGLHHLAHTKGIAIVVIHHVRKTGAADTILVLRRQSGSVTLHARGRDIEEKEAASQFDKNSWSWTILGDAETVLSTSELFLIIGALKAAQDGEMSISEIMAATERRDRNAIDQLLYKMHRDGEVVRVKRGVYGLPKK